MTELLQDKETNDEKIEVQYDRKQACLIERPVISAFGEGVITNPEQGLRASAKAIFSNRNYRVFLATSWVFSTFTHLASYFNLYLRSIGWEVLLIGFVLSVIAVFSSVFRMLGGFVGDVVDRRKISVSAYLVLAVYYIIVGLFVDYWLIVLGFFVYSIHELFRSGSSAYIMENVEKEHSGFALSLFTAGRGLGIIALIAFGFIEPVLGFPQAFRLLYFTTGLFLIISSMARAYYLTPSTSIQKRSGGNILREFLAENGKAARLLVAVAPGLVTVIVLDSMSDSFFTTVALIYAYEILSIDIAGLNLALVFQLLISVPLLLKMGRVSDRKGVKKAALAVYSVMPLSALLLAIAPLVPQIAPDGLIEIANSIIPSLGFVFSTAFIAIVMKYVNDALWVGLIIILIRKKLPKTDAAKILSIFWVIVYVLSSIGPGIAGVIYTFLYPPILFLLVLILNILILIAIAKGPFGNDSKISEPLIEESE
ncbi:MAG: MFS transporter [Candidatus Thorarchaeota archaeon]